MPEDIGELNPVGELNVGAAHLVQEMAEKLLSREVGWTIPSAVWVSIDLYFQA
jgi:hypothetical protein